ncbi:hypothetical protein SAMN05216266_11059 [Amycolatopsis marina]|uniref:Uncharacterized protein n=1 Tax=Amycolatopsis marina TaxID=490629 RepID=A0A1I1AUY8_9PSEU|nr:hypothetical protein [Amycolatopsis marina]SFB40248.1 hypothetical protein SAMN05216266_11059 [Amycolatopsis marina]
MTFAVGIFDLFTYTVPGLSYLSLFTYLAWRFGLVDVQLLGRSNTLVLVIGVVVVSYVLGHVGEGINAILRRMVRRRELPSGADARTEFVGRVPAAVGRSFVDADRAILLAAISLHERELVAEIDRLRASGLMIRGIGATFVLGAGVAAVEVFTGGRWLIACLALLTLSLMAIASLLQSRKMHRWADLRILEICFWIPDIDERLRAQQLTTKAA